MAELLDNLKIQPVTKDDYAAVLAIRENVYKGTDYLPYYYHRLVEAPNSKPFVAVLNGRYVAFTVAFIVDDEQTWIVRSNRVAEDLEGRGIMTWLQGKVEDILKSTTSVKFKVFTTIGTDKSALRQIKEGKLYILLHKEMADFTCDRQTFQNSCEGEHARLLDGDDIGQIFNSEHIADNLFPKQRLVVDYVPFKPIRDNIQYMLHADNVTVVGSNLDSIEHALVTFCYPLPASNGLIYCIDIFGYIGENLVSHIIQHLNEDQAEKSDDKFVIRLVFNKDIEYVDICKKMEDISSSSRLLPVDGLICVEKSLE